MAEPVAFNGTLDARWLVLAMTDGVWKYTGWEVILRIAAEKRREDVIGCLLNRARLARSGKLQDDFTILVISNG
ncbi:MAG TPA: hypothetical protein VKE94_05275 [Gemmataceae bacterium]|nr:hypothetical protein [Gemmataceae bacterium]